MPSSRTRRSQQRHTCPHCGAPAPLGGAVCFPCLDAMAAAEQARRDQGLCLDCWRAPVADGRARVSRATARNTRRRARYQDRKQAGLCLVWQGAPVPRPGPLRRLLGQPSSPLLGHLDLCEATMS